MYTAWLQELLGSSLPSEKSATCDSCAMCSGAHAMAIPGLPSFSPSTKCCTYWPSLPNYLVGAMLTDDRTSHLMEQMISRSLAIPTGLGVSAEYQALYAATWRREFGTSTRLLCPYFNKDDPERSCSIWPYRNSVCLTWFCKFDRGQVGADFWGAVKDLLGSLEIGLSMWAALQLGISGSVATIAPDFAEGQSGVPPRTTLDGRLLADRRGWGDWAGKEREYFVRCHDLVSSLTFGKAVEACGSRVTAHIDRVLAAWRVYEQERRPIPARLRLNRVTVIAMTSDQTLLAGPRPTDPLTLHTRLFHALRHFAGNTVEGAQAELSAELGSELPTDVLQRLLEAEILIASS